LVRGDRAGGPPPPLLPGAAAGGADGAQPRPTIAPDRAPHPPAHRRAAARRLAGKDALMYRKIDLADVTFHLETQPLLRATFEAVRDYAARFSLPGAR